MKFFAKLSLGGREDIIAPMGLYFQMEPSLTSETSKQILHISGLSHVAMTYINPRSRWPAAIMGQGILVAIFGRSKRAGDPATGTIMHLPFSEPCFVSQFPVNGLVMRGLVSLLTRKVLTSYLSIPTDTLDSRRREEVARMEPVPQPCPEESTF